jgi:tetratricopeptide (TPR) repeat protein
MSQRRLSILCIVAAVLVPATAVACLWDYDTLRMERSRFPSILELITGKFLRHTPEFYQWRINDRLRKLQSDPDNLSYYDDLAVAYEKTGQRAKAIETILVKDNKKPGLYETEANLGTFLMLDGKLEEGLKHIDAALRINPDAHFGREKYQKMLAEYIISRKVDGKVPQPLVGLHDPHPDSFREFLLVPATASKGSYFEQGDRDAAVKAVLGMMRFANYDSPLLLEVLGDLLANHFGPDEKQLAARAYLKASYAMNDVSARDAFREKAKNSLRNQSKYREGGLPIAITLKELAPTFNRELAQAQDWFADVRKKELAWIEEGKNPEQEFERLYEDEPRVSADESEVLPWGPLYLRPDVLWSVIGATVCLLVAKAAVSSFIRRRKARAAAGRTSSAAPQSQAADPP